jgi:hypothetical protein
LGRADQRQQHNVKEEEKDVKEEQGSVIYFLRYCSGRET